MTKKKLTDKQEMFCKELKNYVIYSNGDVFSKRKNKMIKGSTNPKTNYNIVLIDGKHIYRHRLIAENFIENKELKRCVNHIDGDKENNCIENLEWCTYKENMKHAIDNNLDGVSGMKNAMSKFNNAQLKEVFNMRKDGKTYRCIAENFNVSQSQIYNIIKGISYKGCVLNE